MTSATRAGCQSSRNSRRAAPSPARISSRRSGTSSGLRIGHPPRLDRPRLGRGTSWTPTPPPKVGTGVGFEPPPSVGEGWGGGTQGRNNLAQSELSTGPDRVLTEIGPEHLGHVDQAVGP